jgi:Fic family protein
MDNIDHESSDTFRRTDDIFLAGYDTVLTPAIMIEQELDEIIQKYYSNLKEGRHPFEAAVIFHYDLEAIHPFADGNGRVGREVLNYMSIREHFPRLLFLGKDREAYISALHKGNLQNMSGIVTDLAELVLDQRMSILTENLRKVIEPPKRKGQMRLSDY